MNQKSNLKRLLSYVKPFAPQILLALFALLITSVTILAIPSGFRYIIDRGLAEKNERLLDEGLIALLIMVVILAAAIFCRFYYMTLSGEKIAAKLRQDVYSHLLDLSPEYYESNRTGDIISRLTADITVIQLAVTTNISIALRHSLTLTGGMIMLFITSPKLAFYMLASIIIAMIPVLYFARKVKKLSKEYQELQANGAAHFEENIYGIKTIQSFAREENERQKFRNINQQILQSATKRTFMRATLISIVIMLVFSAIAFVLWIGGKDVLSGVSSGGDLISFLLYSVFVASSLYSLSEVASDFSRARSAADRLFEVLDSAPQIRNSVSPISLPENFTGKIEFKNVEFTYPSTPNITTLKKLNLQINPGEKIAFVGPSGAGKSTIFDVLLRFYDIKSGEILIDDINLQNIDLTSLRNNIGIVSQDPMIFSGTTYDNIEFGSANAGKDEVISALKSVAAMDFIEKFPDHINAYLGEKGIRLSGGQRQRLAIARVILKNPKILLLDEATSALDSENERLIQQAIDNLAKGRTTLIIAHRLSTIKSADRIVVLNAGVIEAIGTHSELMESSKLYKNLAELQFRN